MLQQELHLVFRVSGVVRDFLVTGNQPSNKNRIQWSGINDLATWSGKQADFQDLSGSGGQIVAILRQVRLDMYSDKTKSFVWTMLVEQLYLDYL